MEEIIYIETKELQFTIKGGPGNWSKNKKYESKIVLESESECRLECSGGAGDAEALSFRGRGEMNIPPVFFESTDYELAIELKSADDCGRFEFHHDNISLRNKVGKTGRSGRLISGVVNFNSEIGFTDLVIRRDGREYLRLIVEIFPSKLDYKSDYESILHDINEEMDSLVYDFVRKTYMNSCVGERQGNTLSEFHSMLDMVYGDFTRALNIIERNPNHKLSKESRVVSSCCGVKAGKESVKWLRKNPSMVKRRNGEYIPEKILSVKKVQSQDTFENRFLKHVVRSVVTRLKRLLDSYKNLAREKDEELKSGIKSKIDRLENYLRTSFLRSVGEYGGGESFSLVLKMASGYREVLKYSIMLKRMLLLNRDKFNISVKNIAKLYELWCFVKINSLLSKSYSLKKNNFIRVQNNGIYIDIQKGAHSFVEYEDEKTGATLKVHYNIGKTTQTVSQKPDNVLSIRKENGSEYSYVFDAKYRIDTGNGRGSMPGPKDEDINTMHRYRDAIVCELSGDYKRENFGAYVLFPHWDEESYKDHRFYKSIEKVNIGGLPFLPSSTKLVEGLLSDIIGESAYSSYERRIDSKGDENYYRDEFFTRRNVLVGTVKNEAQLRANMEYGFYHIPADKINLENREIEYIALYKSKKSFGDDSGISHIGRIESVETVRRGEITSPRARPGTEGELYKRFAVGGWESLKESISVKESGVVVNAYTTEYLIRNASTSNELFIRSKADFRIWYELKREFGERLQIGVGGKQKDGSRRIESMQVDAAKILREDGKVKVEDFEMGLDDFNKTPSFGAKKIIDQLQKQIRQGDESHA